VTPADLAWLRRSIELSARARAEGHHPFGTVLVDAQGRLIAEGMNRSREDATAHSEMVALRLAAGEAARLQGATMYCSTEPCAMCAGAAYWAGIARVVFALSEAGLLRLTGSHHENPTFSLPCREVFARGQRAVQVEGPLLEDDAAKPHCGFWR